jgi:hypothetical protein
MIHIVWVYVCCLVQECRMMFILAINESTSALLMSIYSFHSGYVVMEKIACIVSDRDDVSDVAQFSVKYEQ